MSYARDPLVSANSQIESSQVDCVGGQPALVGDLLVKVRDSTPLR